MRDAVAAQVTGSVSARVAVAVTVPAQAPAVRAGPAAARVRAIGVVEVLGGRLIVAIEDEAQHLRLSEHAHRLAEQPGRRLVRVDDDEEAVDTAADDAAVGHGDDRRRVDDHVVEAAPGFVHHLMQAARLEELVGRRLARPRGNDRQVEHRQLDDDVVQGGAGAEHGDHALRVEAPESELTVHRRAAKVHVDEQHLGLPGLGQGAGQVDGVVVLPSPMLGLDTPTTDTPVSVCIFSTRCRSVRYCSPAKLFGVSSVTRRSSTLSASSSLTVGTLSVKAGASAALIANGIGVAALPPSVANAASASVSSSTSAWISGSSCIRISGSTSAWISGSTSAWISGSMTAWTSGSTSAWISVSISMWISGSMSAWSSGSIAAWTSGSTSAWISVSISMWMSGSMSSWSSGSIAAWISTPSWISDSTSTGISGSTSASISTSTSGWKMG